MPIIVEAADELSILLPDAYRPILGCRRSRRFGCCAEKTSPKTPDSCRQQHTGAIPPPRTPDNGSGIMGNWISGIWFFFGGAVWVFRDVSSPHVHLMHERRTPIGF